MRLTLFNPHRWKAVWYLLTGREVMYGMVIEGTLVRMPDQEAFIYGCTFFNGGIRL